MIALRRCIGIRTILTVELGSDLLTVTCDSFAVATLNKLYNLGLIGADFHKTTYSHFLSISFSAWATPCGSRLR